MEFADKIDREWGEVRAMLIAKNRAYGDSALSPVAGLSKLGAVERLRVRIDDKISRLVRGDDAGEDTEQDLLGYLMLLMVARREERGEPEEPVSSIVAAKPREGWYGREGGEVFGPYNKPDAIESHIRAERGYDDAEQFVFESYHVNERGEIDQ